MMTLVGPTTMSLKAEEPYVLKGTVRVPSTQSSFHSFGLLITDKGRKSGNAPVGQPTQPQFGVDFVTRYLLRCDINVEGVRPADAHKLVLEAGGLHEVDGRPQARLFVSNPTETQLEFEMKAKLISVTGAIVGKEFNLVSPGRSNLSPPERFIARILPGARVRLEEFIPFAVFSGDYQLEASLLVQGRKMLSSQFPVSASEKDYPAQAASVAQIAAGISASPAQVELSLQRGGERFVSVVIANQSTESYTVNATALNRDRTPTDWFIVRPEAFSLPPGVQRKVLVSMPSTRDPDAPHQYGLLNFDLANEAGEALGGGTINVGLLSRKETNPELKVGNLAWDGASATPAVVLPLENKGVVHFPLNARMSLTDADGNRARFIAGYGRWLLPGDSSELRFRLKGTIPPGRYTLRIQVDTKEGALVAEVRVELHQHTVLADVFRHRLRRVPPRHPPQHMRQPIAHAQCQRGQHAVLAGLPQFDGVSGFTHTLLGLQHPRAQDRHQPFIAIHRPLEGLQPLPLKFQVARRRANGVRNPCRAGADGQLGILVEAAHPGRGECGEMQAMLVVGVEPVVVEVDGDNVRQRQLLDRSQCVLRSMKDERDRRQWPAQP